MSEKASLIEINNNAKEIIEISETAQKLLARDHKITVSNAMAIPTIVNAFMKTATAYLAEHKDTNVDVSIDMLGFFDMGVSYRESEDGENDGNFTPFTTPGPVFKKAIKDNDLTEDDDE